MKRLLADNDEEDSFPSLCPTRLGKCEVCNYNNAKYTCPKCEVKTCSIKCLNIHKKELNCDGIRDRTKFIPLKKITKMDFMNDYYFLEECTRYVQDRKTDKMKRYTRYNKTLPSHLFRLRIAAHERKTTIKFLLSNFTRHQLNTTYLDFAQKLIYWRIEWIFMNAGNLMCADEKCNENTKLSDLLEKYFDPEKADGDLVKKHLEVYQSRGMGNVKILLKAEGIQRSKDRFYELDCTKTLRENLAGKIIVEYPIIHLCYDLLVNDQDIIDSDEDVVSESQRYQAMLDAKYRPNRINRPKTEEQIKKEKEEEKKIKREMRKKMKQENETKSKNFLFSEEKVKDDSTSSHSSSSDETEEET